MQRTAVFVDAGYLFAQGSVLLTGGRQGRECLSIDISAVAQALQKVVQDKSDFPLLRIYWYDAMRLGRPTPEQMALADFQNIKIRLGQVNSAGEQKGVDALIVTDLADLARNQAMADAVLVSGDEDLRVGVMLAQQFGVRVHLVGIHPARANQSRSLTQEADTVIEWDEATVRSFLSYTPPISAPAVAAAAANTGLDAQVAPLVASIDPTELAALKTQFANGNNQIPQQYDTGLLKIGRFHYAQSNLSLSERSSLRAVFIRLVQTAP